MSETILKQYDDKCANYDAFQKRLVELLQDFLSNENLIPHSVTGRLKAKTSLYAKVKRPNKDYAHLSDITDICGVRIITYLPDDIDRVAQIVEKEFSIDRLNSTDKRLITDPDRFGYLSLHYVISMLPSRTALAEYKRWDGFKAEIQIRTIIQHAWAEIEHDLGYKSETAMPKAIKRKFFRLAALLELADGEFQTIKDTLDLYKKSVEKSIEASPETVEIDATSLSEFLKGELEIKNCENSISANTMLALSDNNKNDINQYASYLKWVGIITIDDLKKQFLANSQLITKIATIRLTDHDEDISIPRGISLLYLCYIRLVSENDEEKFLKFLKKFNFAMDDEMRVIFIRELTKEILANMA